MMACLQSVHRHRARLTYRAPAGYVIVRQPDGCCSKALMAWFPAWTVERLKDLGMITADGQLTKLGLEVIDP